MKCGKRIALWVLCAGLITAVNAFAGDNVPVKDLPATVVNAIKDRFPGAELISAEKETDDGRVYYEVKIRAQDSKWEVDVSPEGKILDVDKKD